MLRIIWILPGGCALLAIVILVLSFRTLDRPHSQSMPNVPQARFAVIELGEHPEWRQFLALSADQRANELNRLRELLDIKGANDVASDTPTVAAQPANRSNSDLDDGHVLSTQSRATDTGAPTAVQAPIATPDENHPIGIQEDKLAVPTLPEDTRAPIEEEKPTVSAREEKPIAADQRANELNRLHELLDIKGANDVASDMPKGVAQPTNRSDADLDDSDVFSMRSPAADTGASTPIQVPIATPDENRAVGIQEDKPGASTLPDDSGASIQKEKPAVSALEEKPIALGEEPSTKATTDTPMVAAQPANRNNADLGESNALSIQSRAADTGASTPIPVPIATPDENQAVGIQEGKPGASTLPDDSRASVQEKKPAVSALEEKPIALGEEPSTKATTDTPIVAAQPANRDNADLDESNLLSMQSRAADTGASTPIPVPIATPDENQAVGIQEGKPGASTLPDDSRASVRKEKPAVSALEEKPIALGEEKSTKATPDKKSTATKTPRRATPRTQSLSKGVQHVRSRARAPSKQKPSPPQYFFEPFGHQQTSQTSTVNTANQQTRQISTPNANNYFGNQRAGQPEMPNFSNY